MRVYLACTNSVSTEDKSKYILETFYSGEKNCLKALKKCNRENFLLDSGAFSYMNGQKCDKEMIMQYLEKYIAFINKYNIKYFFELDIDVIFGIQFVEQIREKLERETGKKCIPVWHKSRGIEYWKKMCNDYDYVAIGGLAIKHIKQKEYPLIRKMVDYAYINGVKVHGLGFTKTKLLQKEEWRFYSVDSTSWLSAATRGQKLQIFKNGCVENFNKEKKEVKADIQKMAVFNFLEWIKYQKYMDNKIFKIL